MTRHMIQEKPNHLQIQNKTTGILPEAAILFITVQKLSLPCPQISVFWYTKYTEQVHGLLLLLAHLTLGWILGLGF